MSSVWLYSNAVESCREKMSKSNTIIWLEKEHNRLFTAVSDSMIVVVQIYSFLGKLKQKSPIVNIFNDSNLAHFENCAIAIKKARSFATDYFYEQTLNEIRICSKIGYHRNICAMLGYVSTERLTCLLLELAQTNLTSVLEQMRGIGCRR